MGLSNILIYVSYFFCSITYFQKIQEWNYNPRFGLDLIMSPLCFLVYIDSFLLLWNMGHSWVVMPLQGCKKWGDLYCELAGWSTDFHIFIVSILFYFIEYSYIYIYIYSFHLYIYIYTYSFHLILKLNFCQIWKLNRVV